MHPYGHSLQFGIFITPSAADANQVVELARVADTLGIDLVTFQDHPYQPRFLDTWTLLAYVAAQTVNVRVAPNVANLPLRPPFVLARSVASLDVLSGGRVELGLGSGAFWDGIASAGGRKLTPGQGVDALAEALEIIRATWAADGGTIHQSGTHYEIDGARPGPAPAHDIEIWLGAYKPRMLALTGAKADGWLPSTGYLELDQLPEMNAAIDRAAQEADRRPEAIRRMLNITGSFGSGSGFLEGSPAEWARQLADLTQEEGMSTYVLSVSSADEVRRFAEEVAPAVRELVESTPSAPVPELPEVDDEREGAPLAVTPTPDDGTRLSSERVWDEEERPTAGLFDEAERTYTPDEQAAGRHLIDVHDHLRAELDQLRDVVDQVAAGTTDPAAVRSHLTRMTIRQNNWTLGTFCETYCRAVANHHTLEDRSVFPHLRGSDSALGPVIDRLAEEHEVISDLLERVDRSLAELVSSGSRGVAPVHDAIDLLTDALLSHFSYEERELVGPLARHGFY